MDDLINQPKTRQDAPPPPKRRSWMRRFLTRLLLLLAVCAGLFFWMVHKTRSNPPYSTALALIQNDPQLAEHLGQPIRDLRWLPTSGYPKQFQMQVEGPRGKADISVTAGEFDSKWELTAVDVFIREGNERLSLNTGGGAGDAPTWTPGGSPPQSTTPGEISLEPPAGINIELPGSTPPGVQIDKPENTPQMNVQLPPIPPTPEAPKP